MTTLTKAPNELAPAAGAPASAALIGQPIPRLEDAAILIGQARYTDDLPRPALKLSESHPFALAHEEERQAA